MARLSDTRTNPSLEREGVWFDFNGIGLKIARANQPEYAEELKKLSREVLRGRPVEQMTEAESTIIMRTAAAKHLLVDWRDLEDDDGRPIKYSVDQALEYFSQPQYADFLKFVIAQANKAENYRTARLSESAKN